MRLSSPRVLLTGFGAFPGVARNATGLLVSRLVPGLAYADAPGALASARGELRLGRRCVRVTGMVLPVAWEEAGTLVLREIRALRPHVVIMNGVAGPAQPLWIERGAGASRVRKVDARGALPAELATPRRTCRVHMPAHALLRAARAAIAREAGTLGAVMPSARLVAPREDNAYVCNDTTHVVTRGLSPRRGMGVPRGIVWTFLHWPSGLGEQHLPACERVLGAVLAAALPARARPAA